MRHLETLILAVLADMWRIVMAAVFGPEHVLNLSQLEKEKDEGWRVTSEVRIRIIGR
jgi:hypothetical protein